MKEKLQNKQIEEKPTKHLKIIIFFFKQSNQKFRKPMVEIKENLNKSFATKFLEYRLKKTNAKLKITGK